MKNLNLALTVLSLSLSACGGSGSSGASGNSPVAANEGGTASGNPQPSPTPSPSPQPSCKMLSSLWRTFQAPENATMGASVATVQSNGVVYTLDWTQANFNTNFGYAQMPYNVTHTCFYNFTWGNGSYRIDSFSGCDNPTLIDDAGNQVAHNCAYCPLQGNNDLPRVFDYVKSCNSMVITDTVTHNSSVYN